MKVYSRLKTIKSSADWTGDIGSNYIGILSI